MPHRTGLTSWLARVTGFTSQPDEIEVPGVIIRRIDQFLQQSMRLLNIHFQGSDPQTSADAINMGVDWKSRLVERKLKHNGGSFPSYPLESKQPITRFLQG